MIRSLLPIALRPRILRPSFQPNITISLLTISSAGLLSFLFTCLHHRKDSIKMITHGAIYLLVKRPIS